MFVENSHIRYDLKKRFKRVDREIGGRSPLEGDICWCKSSLSDHIQVYGGSSSVAEHPAVNRKSGVQSPVPPQTCDLPLVGTVVLPEEGSPSPLFNARLVEFGSHATLRT